MNQGKLEVVKQEMARVNVNILGISELYAEDCLNSKSNQTLPLNSSTFMILFFTSPIDMAIFFKKN